MQQALRPILRDGGKLQLRQLWLVWLALVVGMFALTPAPKLAPVIAPAPCLAQAPRGDETPARLTRQTRETAPGQTTDKCETNGADVAAFADIVPGQLALDETARQNLPVRAFASDLASASVKRFFPLT